MIDELRVENLALIQSASIEPAAGLTVLTGETGTGKTALLNAVKLLVGERADASMVREGASELIVEGRFFDVDGDDGDGLVVRRRIDERGRGRVSIAGRIASVRELSELIGASVDLCGQHEHQRLLRQQTHVELLDRWAQDQIKAPHQAYLAALHTAHQAAEELSRIREAAATASERVDEAQFVLKRIDEVGPSLEEYAELEESLPRVAHAETLLESIRDARHLLSGDGGVLDTLSTSIAGLEEASVHDSTLATPVATLRSALLDIEDVSQALRGHQDAIDADPYLLQTMQERMSAIHGLMRSYGPRLEDVLSRRASALEIVELAADGTDAERHASEAAEQAERELARAAQTLDDARRKVAPQLAEAITREMSRLEMGSASVEFAFQEVPRSQWGSAGPTHIELLYRPSKGMSARPLRKIASGGEVSRVMLACKVVLGSGDTASTLVFDEVDAGVGGATAVALGTLLAQLAHTHQVIVVTHLAQIAVKAARHYVVEKRLDEASGQPKTMIVAVDGERRVQEIARMLSGDTHAASLAHARQLLDDI